MAMKSPYANRNATASGKAHSKGRKLSAALQKLVAAPASSFPRHARRSPNAARTVTRITVRSAAPPANLWLEMIDGEYLLHLQEGHGLEAAVRSLR